ncbi:MAG: MerR family DNA-binding transcriptional regulator, partial [Acidobacteriota bacterium]
MTQLLIYVVIRIAKVVQTLSFVRENFILSMTQQLLTIQDVATKLGVSPTTLRRWEEKGILIPTRTMGNQRRYSIEQLDQLKNKPQLIVPDPVPQSASTPLPLQGTPQAFVSAGNQDSQKKQNNTLFLKYLAGGIVSGFILLGGFLFVVGLFPTLGISLDKFPQALPFVKQETDPLSSGQVLAANDRRPEFVLEVNVPTLFAKNASFLDSVEIAKTLSVTGVATLSGGIITNNADIDAGTGEVTASNIIYSLLPGSNIIISGDPQNPTISTEGGVETLQGEAGALSLLAGSGVGVSGLTISNTGVLSLQGASGDISLAAGSGIGISGTSISNSDPGSAQSIFKNIKVGSATIAAGTNTDTLTFEAGSGITLTSDTSSKKITIAGTSGGASAWSDGGTLVSLTTTTDNVSIGGTTELGKLAIVGDTDETQLVVRGNGTQTSDLFLAEDSSGTDLFVINNLGQIVSGSSSITLTTTTGDLDADAIGLISSDGSGSTSSGSGLEVDADRLGLIQGCSTGQVLKWDDATSVWECANDTGGGGAGVINIENNDTTVGVNVDTIDFSTDFSLTASPSNEANVTIADDILNFTKFSDSLTIDAATTITNGLA